MAEVAGAAPWRALCRAALRSPLRRPTPRAPKTHPATGLPLSKAKGQHILHNRGIVHKMMEAADVRSVDSVYEVGCGTGELTVELLRWAREVHTVDVEPRMVQEAESRADVEGLGGRLRTRVGDALRLPMPRRFDVCVSNLPYQISSPFIFQLLRRLSTGPAWRSAVLMLQREFAERLLADPGEQPFSRLALNVRLFARVEKVMAVSPGSFIPQPQVHSTVVRLTPRLPIPDVHVSEWDALVRLVFSRRRKTLRAQFKKVSTLSMLEQNYKVRCSLVGQKTAALPFPELVASVLEEEGFKYERAYAMDIDDLHGLLRAFHRRGIYFSEVQGARGREGELLGDAGEGEEDDGSGINPLALLRPGHRPGAGAPAVGPGRPLGRGPEGALSYP